MRPPTRSIIANDESSETLSWEDVIIDVQGPFTKSEEGFQYVLSYHCTKLKVPMLCPFVALLPGYFSRALLNCMLATGVLPDIVRSDRGPEMKNQIMEKFHS